MKYINFRSFYAGTVEYLVFKLGPNSHFFFKKQCEPELLLHLSSKLSGILAQKWLNWFFSKFCHKLLIYRCMSSKCLVKICWVFFSTLRLSVGQITQSSLPLKISCYFNTLLQCPKFPSKLLFKSADCQNILLLSESFFSPKYVLSLFSFSFYISTNLENLTKNQKMVEIQ